MPDLVDVNTLALLLGHLGVEVKRVRRRRAARSRRSTHGRPGPTTSWCGGCGPASACLGPLVARRGRGVVSLPGGCNIGTRPVDLHLAGLAALGAEIRIEHGYVIAEARAAHGRQIDLRGPSGPTVTGTANVMSAATLARGRTVIRGAATEPEIVDLGRFLIAMGAEIEGLGTDTIEIDGVDELGGAHYRIIPDRIEAGTLLMATAITGGETTVDGVEIEHLTAVLDAL